MAGSVHAHNVGVSLLSKVGLERLIARNEDEYVQLALQLASDISTLQNLRMSMRDLMARSPVCDGANFTLGLESTYRNMWRRDCKGDIPSLKHVELLQQPVATDESSSKNSEPLRRSVMDLSRPMDLIQSDHLSLIFTVAKKLVYLNHNSKLVHAIIRFRDVYCACCWNRLEQPRHHTVNLHRPTFF